MAVAVHKVVFSSFADPIEPMETDDIQTRSVIAAAIERLARDWQNAPSLETLADEAGLSLFHFQRLFKRWAGISPKRFAQFVTLGHARHLLRGNESGVLDVSLEVGLSGPSRLHDLFVSCEAMTPGEFKTQGRDMEIRYGWHDTVLGRALIAASPRGICWLSFVQEDSAETDAAANLMELRREWPQARLIEDAAATQSVVAAAFGDAALGNARRGPITLSVHGTNFQIKVWQALLTIPPGSVATYQDIAERIGHPQSVRAVGNAVGANPISFLIPCHRVIRKTGVLDNYRWGPIRKRSLLALEAARAQATQ